MIVFLNGQFVPEEHAVVSAFDRGFLYGDGLFETVRVAQGKLFRWIRHLERLARGAEFLKLSLPFPPQAWQGLAEELIVRNQLREAVLRVTLSRGVGRRGYSPRGADRPTVTMSAHPASPLEPNKLLRWHLATSSFRLPPGEPLAQFKTCNKLPQVLARAEAEAAGAQEALLLNTEGQAVETSSANLFWIAQGTVCTPPLSSGVLPGVTRAALLELCPLLSIPVSQTNVPANALLQADGVFLTLSSAGLVEAVALDNRPLRQSPLTAKLFEAYVGLLARETNENWLADSAPAREPNRGSVAGLG